MIDDLGIAKSIQSLIEYVEKENYIGWDPYDALYNHKYESNNNNLINVLSIQFHRLSPINFRPLFGIKKSIDLKGTAIFAQAYELLYLATGDESLKKSIDGSLDFILKKSLVNVTGYDCWASHYFPYQTLDKNNLDQAIPDIIGTCQSIIALSLGFKIIGNIEYKKAAISATEYIVNNLFVHTDEYSYFKYTPLEKGDTIVPNASAKVLEAISSVNSSIGYQDKFLQPSKDSMNGLLRMQHSDGSWPYSMYINGETKRVQLDFHQGFMIDGLTSFSKHTKDNADLEICIDKALKYYKNKLFRSNGSSYYRYPLRYPIDIHGQAQGIITFAKMGTYSKENLLFAVDIYKWTINNMQDISGYFYYHKWPFFSNKIPFMRWSQSWMMLAMSTLLFESGGGIRY